MSLGPTVVKQQQSPGVVTDVAIVDITAVDGQATMALSFPVVIASDQTDVPIEVDGNTVPQTPTITAGLYAAHQNVGGLLTFANVVSGAGAGGVLKNVLIVDDASQSAILELWLFNQTFTAGADQAAWTPVEAELENLLAVISTLDGTYYTGGATATVCMIETAMRLDLVGTSLFGRLVTRGTPTYAAADDITVKVGTLED